MKRNISVQTNLTEQFSPVLKDLKQTGKGFKVPEGYFDTLSPRIIDSINKQENQSLLKAFFHSFSKPLLWAPAMAAVLVAVVLIFNLTDKKSSTVPVVSEWAQINMAYDASYAEEALLVESNTIDKYIENQDNSYLESIALATANEPSAEEISAYLKEHDNETDLLNEY